MSAKKRYIQYEPSEDNYRWIIQQQSEKRIKNGRLDGLGRIVDQLISRLRKESDTK